MFNPSAFAVVRLMIVELGRLLNRNIGWIRPPQNFVASSARPRSVIL